MYIGVDLGTTACKSCLYDESGALIKFASAKYPLVTMPNGIAEQDANDWFWAAKQTIGEIAKEAGGNIKSICFSTQGISFVAVDRAAMPLCNAISWLDMRAIGETEALERHFGKELIYDKTKKHIMPQYSLPKLMWFKNNCPEAYKKAHKLLMPLDFLNFKLTGKPITDRSMASGTMLYNIDSKKWDGELLDFSGISEEKLPEIKTAGESLGTILPKVADELGLPASTELVLGAQDQKLAAIGAGISEGVCTVSLGTSTAVTKLNVSLKYNCPLFDFDDGRIFAETCLPTTGAAIDWLSSIMGLGYEEMDALAKDAPKGANGVFFDANLSEFGSITQLCLDSSRGDIIRALYECICRGIKEKIDQMGGAKNLRVFGGGFKSELLCKILADTANLEVCVAKTVETAALGAAMLASGCKIKKEL
ncbi:MAG: FGGY family carbohydrate kinase [Oscillospiraceae bacterium]|nr:FGGY family carbohydrate kinase [Oscillospiraceae bacterium]